MNKTKFAKKLRYNMTDAEHKVWSHLRLRQLEGYYFRRQASMGPYVVDFVCHGAKLVIELDGGQHAISVAQDEKRTAWLSNEGYRVIRFWNNEVKENLEGVVKTIRSVLLEAS